MRRDHVAQTIATYNLIAADYKLTATPEMRAWEEQSMRRFFGYLKGKRVLVPGCGDGRDSRFLCSLGLRVTSFDLSENMLKIAMAEDPAGSYTLIDLRDIGKSNGPYDGIYASGCLYHLTKPEFVECVKSCRTLLSSAGVFYLNMKEGQGERFEEKPGPRYPGGAEARERLQGKRFYAYYNREGCCRRLKASKFYTNKNCFWATAEMSSGCANRTTRLDGHPTHERLQSRDEAPTVSGSSASTRSS